MPGKFITLEGGEGSGKSTQSAILARQLESAGLDVLLTREPGGTDGAEMIRNLLVNGAVDRWPPMAETLLHMAARVDHVENAIKPALASGAWVVCDRFGDSTVAYQGAGHGLGDGTINRLYENALSDFSPDLTLILDIGVEEGLARAFQRQGAEDRYERMDLDFHVRIRKAYHRIAESNPDRCLIIEANRSVEAIEADVIAAVREKFGLEV